MTMKRSIPVFLFLIFVVLTLPIRSPGQEKNHQPPFGIVIHGGAGNMLKEKFPEERQKAYQAKLKEALTAGYRILEEGGKSLDAVEAAIRIMEDAPLFNAGGNPFNGQNKEKKTK